VGFVAPYTEDVRATLTRIAAERGYDNPYVVRGTGEGFSVPDDVAEAYGEWLTASAKPAPKSASKPARKTDSKPAPDKEH
jgi:hypothetical protein